MKKVLLLLLLFCIAVAGYSQKVYFIYLQSESGTPFFVKMAGKIYSSTASGYVILPKLVDSTYMLTIGLPGNTKEATFSIAINNNDKGLLVQNADNSLKLYDWQTATIYQPVADNTAPATTAANLNADSFTKLLSAAADDASLLTAPIAVKQEMTKAEEKQVETAKPAVTTEVVIEKPKADSDVVNSTVAVNTPSAPTVDTTAVATTPAETPATNNATTTNIPEQKNTTNEVTAANNNTTVADNTTVPETNTSTSVTPEPSKDNELPFRRSVIMRKSESSTTEGFGLVYIDNTSKGVDTIRLLIPNPKIQFYTNNNNSSTNTVEEKKPEAEENHDNIAVQKQSTSTPATKAPKASCKTTATENDFYKLRRNMAGKVSDDDMVDEAKKAFRKKCYTTEQIKNLSALFLTPAAKYQFFDAAYMHVSNPEQFKSLQSEIKDDYYANRFKALVGNL